MNEKETPASLETIEPSTSFDHYLSGNDSVTAAKRASALKTIIANDPDVRRLMRDRDGALSELTQRRAFDSLHAAERDQQNERIAKLEFELATASHKLNSFRGLFRAFFNKLLGRRN